MTALLLALLTLPFGAPACSGPSRELADREFFSLCHDSSRKTPVWVAYQLTPARLLRTATRPSRFHRDTRLAGPSASDADYLHSGFNRGHMAPAADFAFSDKAIRRTFLLSNAVPQYARINLGRWAQIERAVPSHTFKVVLVLTGTRKQMFAGIVPNTAQPTAPLNHHMTTVDEVERRAGLDFFSTLDDAEERRLESARSLLPAGQ